jgi:uncharacterized protein
MRARREAARCFRCGYYWFARRNPVRICARCKSPYFDEPRLRIPTYGGGLGIEQVIGPLREKVVRLAAAHGARNVRVFGSVARKEATLASDVDLLVDPRRPRYDPIARGIRLESLLGRRVDVVSEDSLPWFIQPQVIVEAVPL